MDHHSADKNYVRYFEEYDATKIVFGEGAVTQLGERLMLDGRTSAALITGGEKSSVESGFYNAFINMSFSFDLETPLFQKVPPEPDVETVRAIVAFLKKSNPEELIAAGGGSVMDAAKAAYLSWQTGMDVTELFGVNRATEKFPDRTFKRVIAIPTTAGTGSEVTPYANIVDGEKNVKCLIMDPWIVPEGALVDSRFCASMPDSLTKATALDALVHCVESLLNTKAEGADPRAEEWALEGIRLIHYALPRVLENPGDPLNREMLSAAATLGGMCIKNRPTSLPHLASFSMYGKVPHGIAVAAFLPIFWNFYLAEESVCSQTMKLAGIFDSAGAQTTPDAVVRACTEFLRRYTGISRLHQMPGFDTAMIQKVSEDALKNPMKLLSAPRPIALEQAKKLIFQLLLLEV